MDSWCNAVALRFAVGFLLLLGLVVFRVGLEAQSTPSEMPAQMLNMNEIGQTQPDLDGLSSPSLHGKVTDFAGEPISNVLLQLYRVNDSGDILVDHRLTTSGLTQNYQFPVLPPGNYKLFAHHPEGILEYDAPNGIRLEEGQTVVADFQMAPFRKGLWRQYSTKDGMPNSVIFDIDYTEDGALWLASLTGIVRFYGPRMEVFQKEDGLLANKTFSIHHPPSCRFLWVGTSKGVSRFDLKTRAFTKLSANQNGLTGRAVFDIQSGEDGTVWMRTVSGLVRYKNETFEEIKGIPTAPGFPSNLVAIGHTGVLWTGSEGEGLWMVKDGVATRSDLIHEHATISSVHVAQDGLLWFAEYSLNTNTPTIYCLKNDQLTLFPSMQSGLTEAVVDMHSDTDGIMWFGEWNGHLTRFDPSLQTFVRMEPGESHGQNLNSIQSIKRTTDGALWCGTLNGLLRFEEGISETYSSGDGLGNAMITLSAASKDGSVWFARNDQAFSELSRWRSKPEHPGGSHFVLARNEGFQGAEIHGLTADPQNGLWISHDNTIQYFDPEAVQNGSPAYRSPNWPKDFFTNPNHPLLFDSNDKVWIGQSDGEAHLWHLPAEAIWSEELQPNPFVQIENPVELMYQDSRGALWASYSNEEDEGDALYQLEGDQISTISTENADASFSSGDIHCIGESEQGLIYIERCQKSQS